MVDNTPNPTQHPDPNQRERHEPEIDHMHRIRTITLTALALAALMTATTSAQEPEAPIELWRAGGIAGFSLIGHATSGMTGLPGIPSCCPGYDGGSGSGWNVGPAVELPLANKLSGTLRLMAA